MQITAISNRRSLVRVIYCSLCCFCIFPGCVPWSYPYDSSKQNVTNVFELTHIPTETDFLNLSHNLLTEVVGTLWPGLRMLDLRYNRIQEVRSSDWGESRSLDFLLLGSNQLLGLPDLNFLNATLVGLDVSNTKLLEIREDELVWLTQLRYLSLHGNSLSGVDLQAFCVLPKLADLDLSNNSFQSVPPDLECLGSRLRRLRLSNNSIGTVDNSSLASMGFLYYLDLSYNSLKTIDGLEGMAASLVELHLDHNNLTSLQTTLQNFHRLTNLTLTYNPLVEITTKTVQGSPVLQMELHHGKLTCFSWVSNKASSSIISQFITCDCIQSIICRPSCLVATCGERHFSYLVVIPTSGINK